MPRFTTRIRAGNDETGNIFVVLGTATRLLRELGVPPEDLSRLRADVYASTSYDEAIAHVERWFPVDR